MKLKHIVGMLKTKDGRTATRSIATDRCILIRQERFGAPNLFRLAEAIRNGSAPETTTSSVYLNNVCVNAVARQSRRDNSNP
ncbi:MAG: hypothetical protein MUC43_00315 [Pirellula sp.]|nr:hypothetical protein [Pirellula sp.]